MAEPPSHPQGRSKHGEDHHAARSIVQGCASRAAIARPHGQGSEAAQRWNAQSQAQPLHDTGRPLRTLAQGADREWRFSAIPLNEVQGLQGLQGFCVSLAHARRRACAYTHETNMRRTLATLAKAQKSLVQPLLEPLHNRCTNPCKATLASHRHPPRGGGAHQMAAHNRRAVRRDRPRPHLPACASSPSRASASRGSRSCGNPGRSSLC